MARVITRIPVGIPPKEGEEDTRQRVKLTDSDEVGRALAFLSQPNVYFQDERALRDKVERKLRPPVPPLRRESTAFSPRGLLFA